MGCAPKRRLGRDRSRLALCGHPRVRKAWMAGTRPAMTIRQRPVALFDRRERRRHHESSSPASPRRPADCARAIDRLRRRRRVRCCARWRPCRPRCAPTCSAHRTPSTCRRPAARTSGALRSSPTSARSGRGSNRRVSVYWRISNSGPIWRGSSGGENGAGTNTSLCWLVTNSRIGGGQFASFNPAARTAARCSKLS